MNLKIKIFLFVVLFTGCIIDAYADDNIINYKCDTIKMDNNDYKQAIVITDYIYTGCENPFDENSGNIIWIKIINANGQCVRCEKLSEQQIEGDYYKIPINDLKRGEMYTFIKFFEKGKLIETIQFMR